MDEHLREVEAAMGVRITRRNERVHIDGPKEAARQVLDLLISLHERASRPLPPQSLQLALAEARAQLAMTQAAGRPRGKAAGAAPALDAGPHAAGPDGAAVPPSGASSNPLPDVVLHTRRPDLRGRTPNQVQYLRQVLATDITFGIGPAGTGKTFLAVACAVDALERQGVQRIVLTRPAVEAGERLGFLPGDLAQKVDPYLRPLYDALYDLMGFDRVTRAFERGQLEIAPLAFMRGRTLNQAFVILDEAQNTTREQMKMFLTRIGFGSKCVVTGDVSQIDLPSGVPSGLVDAAQVLQDVKGIAFTRFTAADVVRHPLVARIVEAYDAAQTGRSGGPASGGSAWR
jgi:phosphate starvation-inducible PhoH-like protein